MGYGYIYTYGIKGNVAIAINTNAVVGTAIAGADTYGGNLEILDIILDYV